MLDMEFVKDQISKTYTPIIHDAIVNRYFHSGLLALGCGESTIRIISLLYISKTEIDRGL